SWLAFEDLGDPGVRLGAGLRRELGVERFPDQRVPEPVHRAGFLTGAEQANTGGAVTQPGHRTRVRAERRRDYGRVDARAERRRGGQHRRSRVAVPGVREAGDLAADGLPDT